MVGVQVVADGDLVEMTSIPCDKSRRRRVEPAAHPSYEAREGQTSVFQTGSWDNEQEPHVVGRVARNTSQTHLFNSLQAPKVRVIRFLEQSQVLQDRSNDGIYDFVGQCWAVVATCQPPCESALSVGINCTRLRRQRREERLLNQGQDGGINDQTSIRVKQELAATIAVGGAQDAAVVGEEGAHGNDGWLFGRALDDVAGLACDHQAIPATDRATGYVVRWQRGGTAD